MLVLFPFEVDFYRSHEVDVRHVGHPLVDEIPSLPQIWDAAELEGGGLPEEPTISLLPGSRRSEINALLPWMLEAMSRLADLRGGKLTCRLIQAPNIPDSLFDDWIEKAGLDPEKIQLERVHKDRLKHIANGHLALCASGTATLEVALLKTPMVVMYRLKWSSYMLGRLLVDLPFFCMVNLVLDRGVVPELLQHEAQPDKVAAKIHSILSSRQTVDEMRRGLADLRPALGASGASVRAAEAVADRLRGDAS